MAEEIKSNRGLADILGVNESSIRRAEEKGRIAIKRDDEGNIDVEDAKKQWQMAQNAGKGDVALTYQRSRASKEFYEFQIKKLEYEERAGKLIPLAQAQSEAFAAARFSRDQLLMIPRLVAPRLIGQTNISDIEYTLTQEITEALRNLCNILQGNKGEQK